MFVQRLKGQYVQQWYRRIHMNSKLMVYTCFKSYEHESYLHCTNIRKFRRVLAQFRVSAHGLEIEKGRYSGTARTERICKLGKLSIEDEYHFVLICDIFKDLRVKYLPCHHQCSNSINFLMTQTNKYRLILLYSCFMLQRDALDI